MGHYTAGIASDGSDQSTSSDSAVVTTGRRASETELVFPGDSEMSRRMREFDWSRTSAGAVAGWPASLKTSVGLILNSRYPMFIWWGAEHLTNLYNDAYIPVLGAKHPQALGRSGAEVWAEIWDTLRPFADGVFQEGRANWSEELMLVMERHGYREETFFTFSYSPIFDADGSVGGLFCACNEDTRRVVAERRLRTQRELAAEVSASRDVDEACGKVAACLASNPHDLPFALVYLLDDGGTVARLAAATGAEAGRDVDTTVELSGPSDPWGLGVVAETRARRVVAPLERAFLGAVPSGPWDEPANQAVVTPLERPGFDALAGFAVFGVSPRRKLDDDSLGFCDLLARHIATGIGNARAYDDERRRVAALAELDRAKTAFFSNVSHEFRTPLTLMLGPLEDALQSSSIPPAERGSLDVAHRNGLRLLRMVNTLLDFSRIEAGRAEATFEKVDAAQLTEDLASVFRSAIERAGLSFDVHCEPPVSPVFLDRDMWEKVVLNLLSNAFKFTLRGSIAVSLAERGGFMELAVRDTGTGIPAEELPHVFERFHTVRGTEGRTHEGTGIGLALVSELVKLHGGIASVESELGRGTTFSICIPTGSEHLPQDRIGVPRRPAATGLGAAPFVQEALRWIPDLRSDVEALPDVGRLGAVTTSGAKLLVVDDNADMRSYLARLLRPYWEVEIAADGEEALHSIRERRPDLVLSDVMMPRRDGIELTRALRSDPERRTVPVILVSARAGEESRMQGVEAGADDYLTKPFTARELVARVNANLEMARARAEALADRERTDAVTAVQKEAFEQAIRGTPTEAVLNLVTQAAEQLTGSGARAALFLVDPEGSGVKGSAGSMPESAVRAIATSGKGSRWSFPVLTAGARVLGALSVSPAPPREPDERDRAAMELLAHTAALLIERHRANEERERARVEAESANRAKDEFLAVLSHELRSPLNAMLGWVRVLKRAGSTDDLVVRAVETLERNVWSQSQVINDLLDISRITAGKLELERTRVDLAAVVAGAVESMRPSAAGRQIALDLEMSREQLEVDGDAARLQQVIGNLLHNAVKFSSEGGRISVRAHGREGRAIVAVEDTGEGIDPEILPHIFDRFVQSEAITTRRHGGLGLGLAIVKQLTALHGGRVEVASDGPGRGARFTVDLPLAVPLERGREPSKVEQVTAPTPGIAELDVLLVEDDRDSREALALAIEQSGAQVRLADSVRQALEQYSVHPPDVLLSDIGMPREDGYTLIRAIREREEGTRRRTLAIAMTGFATRQDHESALQAGFDDHVGKPVELEALLECIRALAETRQRET